jgi:NAD(P)-dependent dehydrogenase (short-subunit alcohol dehydrogenase family)
LALSRRQLALGALGASLLPLPLPAGAVEPAAAAAADGAGRLALVTGANSGIGYETALGLARAGYVPLLACRTVDKGRAAAARIAAAVPGAAVRVLEVPLELGELRSVAAYADAVRATGEPLHLLVNNAVRSCVCCCVYALLTEPCVRPFRRRASWRRRAARQQTATSCTLA